MTTSEKSALDCKAVKGGDDVWRCERCALAWHDAAADRPGCDKITFSRLRKAADDEAQRIEQSQRARVAAGDRVLPHTGELTRAMEFQAIVRLIGKCAEEQRAKGGKQP